MHNDLLCVADVTVVLAERKLTSYVYAVVYVCMASKLPLVEPIHISSGLVYNLIMMAFKEGLKVRYSSDDPAWEVGALQFGIRAEFLPSSFTVLLPTPQF
ncbi:hypothetical protein TIFTF001_051892 [Ficus carica]|uniref:Uncharacterized protein n=1 Tax=Ficus carica TaxID=3494 RepID=A0AA88JCN9_FICCA|nr:hypothetical protein TIFTF001_051892 [Ficus carica]